MCKHNHDPVSPCLYCILGLPVEDDLWYIKKGTKRSLNNTLLEVNDYYSIRVSWLSNHILARINRINSTSMTITVIANQKIPSIHNVIIISFTSIISLTKINLKTDLPLYIHYEYKSEEFVNLLKGN
jgi:hypothetical protein